MQQVRILARQNKSGSWPAGETSPDLGQREKQVLIRDPDCDLVTKRWQGVKGHRKSFTSVPRTLKMVDFAFFGRDCNLPGIQIEISVKKKHMGHDRTGINWTHGKFEGVPSKWRGAARLEESGRGADK